MSTCSVEQDEEVVRKFRKTPETPMKTINQSSRQSCRKRSLFQPSTPTNSPAKSDDLGPMSPLSSSSYDSNLASPCFSPNGKFSTPPKSPISSIRNEGSSYKKTEFTSGIFPSLRLLTPKSNKSPRTPRRSGRLISKMNKTSEDILRDLTTPPRSSNKGRKVLMSDYNSDSSQNIFDSTPRRSRKNLEETPESKLEISPISAEDFYGNTPALPNPCSQLFIDTTRKITNRKRMRSVSMDSISSNRSFVSGSGHHSMKSHRRVKTLKGLPKGPYVGVWHGIKKPKTMTLSKTNKKPKITPESRIKDVIESGNTNQIQVKPKRIFEEKPRRRLARKRSRTVQASENKIIDPFPHYLIKRKMLPTATHSSNKVDVDKGFENPDLTKKFLKHGVRRKATFTLNNQMKVECSNGIIKLLSPKKYHKLYSPSIHSKIDFFDDDDKTDDFEISVEKIVSKLENETQENPEQKETMRMAMNHPVMTPANVQLTNTTDDQLLNILSNPVRNVSQAQLTEVKSPIDIKIDSGDQDFSYDSSEATSKDNSDTLVSIEKLGWIRTQARNVLSELEQLESSSIESSIEGGKEKVKSSAKLYSLFYKENWSTISPSEEFKELSSLEKKKQIKVPDDQYLLDAGQKSIGIVTCGKCGVMYQAGDFADEATHRNFHNHLPELRYTGWTNERIVGRYLDGRVIMVINSDPKSWWHKVTKIVDIVDQELGYPEGTVKALFHKTAYLFISEKAKQVVGCLIAEECKEGFKMFPSLEGVDIDSCSKDPSPCKVGINRIWTALNHRRRGVAKRMIDCMRRTFIHGELVPMDLVAFSVPSPSGKLLAQNVTGKSDFLVYGFV